jgi:hypothetical protein
MGLKDIWHGIWNFFKNLFSAVDKQIIGVAEFVDKIEAALLNAQQQLKDFQTFDFDPKFKTRVISVPRAVNSFQDLWLTITQDLLAKFRELENNVKFIKDRLTGNVPREGTEAEVPAAVNLLSEIQTFLTVFGDTFTKLVDLTGTIDDIKKRIETLDDLFLPQGSTKTTVDIKYRKRNAA